MKEKSIADYGKHIARLSGAGLAGAVIVAVFIAVCALSEGESALKVTQGVLHIQTTPALPVAGRALLAVAVLAYWSGYVWALYETWRLGRDLRETPRLHPRLAQNFTRISAALVCIGIGAFVAAQLPRWVAHQYGLAFEKPDYYGALLIAMIASAICDCVSRLLKQGAEAQAENEGFI